MLTHLIAKIDPSNVNISKYFTHYIAYYGVPLYLLPQQRGVTCKPIDRHYDALRIRSLGNGIMFCVVSETLPEGGALLAINSGWRLPTLAVFVY
ncbi:hypothetical protein [Mixta sp. Marseille-Q2659]|uniref:hypothetical protein n=1 Tax=Mixta sp. Marseille-Q2659 TaxID=2736607 RepID=UPI0023B8A928|nr:hypothetical protein [Mixta sp. Marseille-Q2659]